MLSFSSNLLGVSTSIWQLKDRKGRLTCSPAACNWTAAAAAWTFNLTTCGARSTRWGPWGWSFRKYLTEQKDRTPVWLNTGKRCCICACYTGACVCLCVTTLYTKSRLVPCRPDGSDSGILSNSLRPQWLQEIGDFSYRHKSWGHMTPCPVHTSEITSSSGWWHKPSPLVWPRWMFLLIKETDSGVLTQQNVARCTSLSLKQRAFH